MKVKQFYDEGLAHASYAIISKNEMAVIDPGRDPKPYIDHAASHQARIKAIIETHPHADFVSSHLELSKLTGAKIYASKLVGAEYPSQSFDEGDLIAIGDVQLKAINTPGHSPDSISVLVLDENKKQSAVFTGDTLFVGDVGRPDLREKAGNTKARREELAEMLFHTIREKLFGLPDEVIVYPAHGAGSLCGKNMRPELSSTIGLEKKQNYAFQEEDKKKFIDTLLADQPFIPKYFSYNVMLNKQGAEDFEKSVNAVPVIKDIPSGRDTLIVDARSRSDFEKGHIHGAIHIMDGKKFETWLGSIIGPEEKFYLIAKDSDSLGQLIRKAAKIGYEKNIIGGIVQGEGDEKSLSFDVDEFRKDPDRFTIVDVRNPGEVKSRKIFPNSVHVPLPELRERIPEIPTDKPIVVHCAGGYRSALGSSIIQAKTDQKVYDLGNRITEF